MTPQDLLAISPEFLAKAVLHRREKLVSKLPEQMSKRQDERQNAEKLARSSKAKRDDLNSKVANLKKERNDAQTGAQELIIKLRSLSKQNSSSEFTVKTNTKIESKQEKQDDENSLSTIKDLQSVLLEHQGWSNENIDSKDIMAQMNELHEQAHYAMVELSKENNKVQSIWLENESHRRRCESRYTKLNRSKKESDDGVEFWSQQIKSDFTELLADAKRVSDGGLSSRTLMKQNSNKPDKRRKK
jgi:chromosome segregation ATPase